MKHVSFATGILALALLLAAPGYGAPGMMSYQGHLVNYQGMPLTGSFGMQFAIFDDSTAGLQLWEELHEGVAVSEGYFTVTLGKYTSIPDGVFEANDAFLQVTVGGEALSPRTRLTSHPYSFRVSTLDGSRGGTVGGAVVIRMDPAMRDKQTVLRVEDTAGAPLIEAAASPQVSSCLDFYDPIDSKGGAMATELTAQIGSDGMAMYQGADTVLSYVRGSRMKVVSHGSFGGSFFADSAMSWGGEFEGAIGGVVGVCWPEGDYNYAGLMGDCEGGSGRNVGVFGQASNTNTSLGVQGLASGAGTNYGVAGGASGGTTNYGIYGYSGNGPADYAGYFQGNVQVAGMLSKSAGSFKIDHPLDPENKYLYHSFVESPDMKNVYDGVAVLDSRGEATVTLPDYFEALNRDFRYQLTAIGGAMPELHVGQKIDGNRFRIAGGKPGMEVSWQVTGIRQDAYANEHRIPEEELKPAGENGKYLHPELYGYGSDRRVGPEEPKKLERPTSSSEE